MILEKIKEEKLVFAYSKELLDRLIGPVSKKILSPIDRLGIVRDLFSLSESGVVSTSLALEFLEAYKNEDDYVKNGGQAVCM